MHELNSVTRPANTEAAPRGKKHGHDRDDNDRVWSPPRGRARLDEGNDDSSESHRRACGTDAAESEAVREILQRFGPLSSLKAEDWDVVLHPVGELRPYLTSTATASSEEKARRPHQPSAPATLGSGAGGGVRRCGGGGAEAVKGNRNPPDSDCSASSPQGRSDSGGTATHRPPYVEDAVVQYVKCRAAELPMRLQTEAMQLRRHEQNLRSNTKELIQLSEFLAYVDHRCPAELDTAPGHRGHAGQPSAVGSSDLTASVELLVSPVEAQRRVTRAKERVAELEGLIKLQAGEKVRCAERMVLLSAMTALMLERVFLGNAPQAHDTT